MSVESSNDKEKQTAERCIDIMTAKFFQKFYPNTDGDTIWRKCIEQIKEEYGV